MQRLFRIAKNVIKMKTCNLITRLGMKIRWRNNKTQDWK